MSIVSSMSMNIRVFGGVFFLITLYVWQVSQPQYTQVTILDVGQGSGAYIKVDNGFEILVDVGETNKTLRNLSRFRPWWDRHIDLIITSHSDKDHTGMVPKILRRFRVGGYIESPKPGTDGLYKSIHKELEAQDIPLIYPEHIDLSQDVFITFLHPQNKFAQEYSDNDASLVFVLQVRGTRFLFMGDASSRVENELIRRYGKQLDVDVLIVGHHGSKTSTSQVFLDITTPEYGVISAGAENTYGHPHQSVIKRLEEHGVVVLRTDTLGNVQFKVYENGEFDIIVR